MINDRQKSEKS